MHVPGDDLAEGVLRDAAVGLRVDVLVVVGGAEGGKDQVAVREDLKKKQRKMSIPGTKKNAAPPPKRDGIFFFFTKLLEKKNSVFQS